ncbi:MAG: hypothetical protein K940chlam3_01663 [Chlamydiae bacterium]|nr:hypothetical protein [Chlamydiota bacterium]
MNPVSKPVSEIKSLRKVHRPDSPEKQETFLKKYDFFVLIDRSGSMKSPIEEGEKDTRWETVKEYLKVIVSTAVEYDPDGVEVCFFDTRVEWIDRNVESASQVDEIFNGIGPRGVTNLADALNQTFTRHFDRKAIRHKEKEKQKSIVIVITDGIPFDGSSNERAKSNVNKAIVDATNRLSKRHMFRFKDRDTKKWVRTTTELGIRFFQVGDDKKATKYLKELDDDLSAAKADIVDTGDIEELTGADGVRNAFIDAIFN